MEKKVDVRKIRLRMDLTLAEFAVKLGVAEYTVRRWESGKTAPSRMARKLIEEVEKQ